MNVVLSVIASGHALPPGHPAHGKDRVEGRPCAYVCSGQVCSLPVTRAGDLAALLKDPVSSNVPQEG